MLDPKFETLLVAAEQKSFAKTAEFLSLTDAAVTHHIRLLERTYGKQLFLRKRGSLTLTREGEILVKYVKRFKALEMQMQAEMADAKLDLNRIRVGVTHALDSSLMIEDLARYSGGNPNVSITVITDTTKKLYAMLENFEIDIAIVEGRNTHPEFESLMLDTDCLSCVMSGSHPLARRSMITLAELKKEPLILRPSSSATRRLFESALEGAGESISAFDVIMEIDNITTIKDLIRKELGISILARSVCMEELRAGTIAVLPIENLNMVQETDLVYHKTFPHTGVLRDFAELCRETARKESMSTKTRQSPIVFTPITPNCRFESPQ